ncbi:MAG: hypothetical protein J5685_00445 [Clostridiales bacterium]|nr:hypothetical protein [Clostridiales bacterium]
MKKALSMILTAAMAAGTVGGTLLMTGCHGFRHVTDGRYGTFDTADDPDTSYDIDPDTEPPQLEPPDMMNLHEGPMLQIDSEVIGPIDWEDEDRITGSTYTVNWDGTAVCVHHHDNSDDEIIESTISTEDWWDIYLTVDHLYTTDACRDYREEDVCDGEMFYFRYYPEGGDQCAYIYGGYCYGNDDLWGIANTVSSYFYEVPEEPVPELTIDDLQARSGTMLSISIYEPGDREMDDYVCYWVQYSGTIYRITRVDGGETVWDEATASDEDYMTFYGYLCDLIESDLYDGYVAVDDSESRWIINSDLPEQYGAILYSGPVGGYEDLQAMGDLAAAYFE